MTQIKDRVSLDKPKPLVVAGIPAFNEEKSIARLVLEAQKHVDVVLVCDDGSTDLTAEIAERIGAYVIRHGRNLGYGAATKSLFTVAKELNADVLVTLDGDGQHDPGDIPALVKPVLAGEIDIVLGSRFVDSSYSGRMPLYRRLGVKAISRLANGFTKNRVSDAQNGFRAYGRRALECLNVCEADMGASVEILLKARKHGLRVCEVPIRVSYDNGGVPTSSKNPLAHGANVVMSILRYVVEEKPLMTLGPPAIIFLLAGIGFGSWMLHIYSVEHYITTNIALAAIAFLLLGLFLLSTAITLYAISRVSNKMNGKG